MLLKRTRLALLATTLFCLAACSSTPVAVSCPPPPSLPPAIEQLAAQAYLLALPASPGSTLTEEWALHFRAFLSELEQALNAATLRSLDSPPASSGRSDKGS